MSVVETGYRITCDACGGGFDLRPSAALVGQPCACGAPILTAADYDLWMWRVVPLLTAAVRAGLIGFDDPDARVVVERGVVRVEWP